MYFFLFLKESRASFTNYILFRAFTVCSHKHIKIYHQKAISLHNRTLSSTQKMALCISSGAFEVTGFFVVKRQKEVIHKG